MDASAYSTASSGSDHGPRRVHARTLHRTPPARAPRARRAVAPTRRADPGFFGFDRTPQAPRSGRVSWRLAAMPAMRASDKTLSRRSPVLRDSIEGRTAVPEGLVEPAELESIRSQQVEELGLMRSETRRAAQLRALLDAARGPRSTFPSLYSTRPRPPRATASPTPNRSARWRVRLSSISERPRSASPSAQTWTPRRLQDDRDPPLVAGAPIQIEALLVPVDAVLNPPGGEDGRACEAAPAARAEPVSATPPRAPAAPRSAAQPRTG